MNALALQRARNTCRERYETEVDRCHRVDTCRAVQRRGGADKESGDVLGAPPYTRPPPPGGYAAPAAPSGPALPREGDATAARLADQLPIDRATKDLSNQLPADVRGTEQRLGLRVPSGPRTNLTGHTPTVEEIIDALAHH